MAWPELGLFIWFVLAAQGLGRAAEGLLFRPDPLADSCSDPYTDPNNDRLDRFLWTQALGLASLTCLAGLLSLVGLLRPGAIACLMVPAGLVGLVNLVAVRPRRFTWAGLSVWEKVFIIGLIGHQTVGLFQALAPPTWGEGIHTLFVFTRDYLSQGQVHFLPDRYASRPQNMVLLYSLVQAFGRAEASQLIGWWFGLLAALKMIQLGRLAVPDHRGRTMGLLAGLMLSAMPLFGLLSGRGMSDLGLLFFALSGLEGVWRWAETGARSGRFWAVAVCVGLCPGFKAVGLGTMGAAFLFGGWRLLAGRLTLGRFIQFILISLVIAAPWYVYAYLHTGDPFFIGRSQPRGILTKSDLTRMIVKPASPRPVDRAVGQTTTTAPSPATALVSKPDSQAAKPGPVANVIYMIKYMLTRQGANLIKTFWDVNLMAGHRGRIVGPFLLALVPLFFLVRPRPAGLTGLTGLGLIQFGITAFLFGPYARYGLPGLALLILTAAWCWQAALASGRLGKGLALAVLAAGWLVFWPEAGYKLSREFRVAVGLTDRATYLKREFGTEFELYDWANNHLPKDAVVALIADHRPYYLHRKYFFASLTRNPFINYESLLRSKGAFDKRVRSFGATHVLINTARSDNAWDDRGPAAVKSLVADSLAMLKDWTKTDLEKLACRGQACLYRLKGTE